MKERVKLTVAAGEAPRRRALLVDRDALVAAAGVTRWVSDESPPMTGVWEVTDHATGEVQSRWWFDAAREQWHTSPLNPVAGYAMKHEDFVKTYAWRGLVEMPANYSCPPYDLRSVPKGAQLGVAIPEAAQRVQIAPEGRAMAPPRVVPQRQHTQAVRLGDGLPEAPLGRRIR